MSDDDRMDRAERIRELREGRRAGAHGASVGTDSDGGDAETDAGDAPGLDDAVVAAVERVSEASASIPAAEEMGASEVSVGSIGDPEPTQGESAGGAATDTPADDSNQEPESTRAEAAGFAAAAETTAGHRGGVDTRVLEFGLGDERYCIDIDYVEEIVKDETITRVPNTPEFVEGVVDLRGQITTILNPKLLLETEEADPGDVLVVFEAEAVEDQGHLGWIVDDVHQVAPVVEAEVTDPPMAEEYVNGVIDRGEDEPFVVWTSPEDALESTT